MNKNMWIGFIFGVCAVALGMAGYNFCADAIKAYQEDKAEEEKAKVAEAKLDVGKIRARRIFSNVAFSSYQEYADKYARAYSEWQISEIDKENNIEFDRIISKTLACKISGDGLSIICNAAKDEANRAFGEEVRKELKNPDIKRDPMHKDDLFFYAGLLKYLCDDLGTVGSCRVLPDIYRPGNDALPAVESKKLYLDSLEKLCNDNKLGCYAYAKEYLDGELVDRDISKAIRMLTACSSNYNEHLNFDAPQLLRWRNDEAGKCFSLLTALLTDKQ